MKFVAGSDTFSKDGAEEQCEFSKKLILCLEEKAKRVTYRKNKFWFLPKNSKGN